MFDVQYISPPRYLSKEKHNYYLIRLHCLVGESTHQFRIHLCQGDKLISDTHLLDVYDNEYFHLIAPRETTTQQSSVSLRIDVSDRLTGGVLLSFLTPLAEIPSVTNIPLSGVANPLFPRPPAITITASSQSILTLAPPEHWKHEKHFLVLRPHVVPESLAPWFPPAAAPHISEPCLLHDTQTINVGSLVLSKEAAQVHQSSTLLVSAHMGQETHCLGYVVGGRGLWQTSCLKASIRQEVIIALYAVDRTATNTVRVYELGRGAISRPEPANSEKEIERVITLTCQPFGCGVKASEASVLVGKLTLRILYSTAPPPRLKYSIDDCCADIIRYHITDLDTFDTLDDEICVSVVGQWLMQDSWAEALAAYSSTGVSLSAIDGNGWTRLYAVCLCLSRLAGENKVDVRLGNVQPSVVGATLLESLLKYANEAYASDDREYIACCVYLLLAFVPCNASLLSGFFSVVSHWQAVLLLARASLMISEIVQLEECITNTLSKVLQFVKPQDERYIALANALCELVFRPLCGVPAQPVSDSVRRTAAAQSTMITVPPLYNASCSRNVTLTSSTSLLLLEQSKLLSVITSLENELLEFSQHQARHSALSECWRTLRDSLVMLFRSIAGRKDKFIQWANSVSNSFTRFSLLRAGFTAGECDLCFGIDLADFEEFVFDILQYLTQLYADNVLENVLLDGDGCVGYLKLLRLALIGSVRLCSSEDDVRFACITAALPPIMKMLLMTAIQSFEHSNSNGTFLTTIVQWFAGNISGMVELLVLQLNNSLCNDVTSVINVVFAFIEVGCDVHDSLENMSEEKCSDDVRMELRERLSDATGLIHDIIAMGVIRSLPRSYLDDSIAPGATTLKHVADALCRRNAYDRFFLNAVHIKNVVSALHSEACKRNKHSQLLRMTRSVLHVLGVIRLIVGSLWMYKRDSGRDILSLSDSDEEGHSNSDTAMDDTAVFDIYLFSAAVQGIFLWNRDKFFSVNSSDVLSQISSLQKILSSNTDFLNGAGFNVGCITLKSIALNSFLSIKAADMQYQALHRQLCSALLRSGLWDAGKEISHEHQLRHERELASVKDNQQLVARLSALLVEEKRQKDIFHERIVHDSALRLRPVFYAIRFVTPPWVDVTEGSDADVQAFLSAIGSVCPVLIIGELGNFISEQELWLVLRFDHEAFSAAHLGDDDIHVFGSYSYVLDKLLAIFHDYNCVSSDALFDASAATCSRKRVLQVFEILPHDPFSDEPDTALPQPAEARRNTEELLDVLYRNAPGLGTETSVQKSETTLQSIPENITTCSDPDQLSPAARLRKYHPRCLEFLSCIRLPVSDKVGEALKPVRVQLNLAFNFTEDINIRLNDFTTWSLHCSPCAMVSSVCVEPMPNVIRCCTTGLRTLQSDFVRLSAAINETYARIQTMNASAAAQLPKSDVVSRNAVLHHAAAVIANALSSSPTAASSCTLSNSEVMVIAEEQRREMLWHSIRKEAKKTYNTRKSQYDISLQRGEISDAPPTLDLDRLETEFYSEVSGSNGKIEVADFLALRSEVLSMVNNTLKFYRSACMSINQKPQSLSRAELRKMRSVSSEEYAKTKLSMPAYAPQIKQRELHEADERLEDADDERLKWLQIVLWLEAHYFAMDCGEAL